MRFALLVLLFLAAQARAQTDPPAVWPEDLVDPGAVTAPADLLLPMPCGAAMAFQKVVVPVDAGDPLDDRRLRLGQSLDQTGYADYLHPTFLRGAFSDPATGRTHFYIARYELTRGQYRALQGDCAPPERPDRVAQGGLSWFDAVAAARDYTVWLLQNAPHALPREDGAPGFLRLPTEAEWEYATRGGARIDATKFPALRFFGQGDMNAYALYQTGSGRGRLGPVGLRKPNPLGLYDVYGNAEELMLEPFRLNAIGRLHGQAGGIVTRGGSVLSTAEQIYTAQRTEYPPFDSVTGAPLRSDTFGLRLVLSAHVATTDRRLRQIQDRWATLANEFDIGAEPEASPLAQLSGLIEAETDPRRQAALNDLMLEFRRALDRAQTALQQSARSTLLSGAVFTDALVENAAQIVAKSANIRMLIDLQRAGDQSPFYGRQVEKHVAEIKQMRRVQSTYLLSFRAALETLAVDIAPPEREAAFAVLREELALSGRGETLAMLERFWADLSVYAARPDMSPAALLDLALE